MNSRNIFRRNVTLLSLFIIGSLLLAAFSLLQLYYQQHPDNPCFFLRINEVCTVNTGNFIGDSIFYEDYIELYNPTDMEISLEHLFLSDSTDDYGLGALPSDVIAPKGYYVIYASGENSNIPENSYGLPFRLSENETLTLSWCTESEEGIRSFSPIDSIFIPALYTGAVYSRTKDGDKEFAQMRPSPGISNQTSPLVLDMPGFSAESGFYEAPFTLELEVPDGCSVYYTLDGSHPGPDSLLYTAPLNFSELSSTKNVYSAREDITGESCGYLPPNAPVDKSIVIRAATYDSDGNYSNTATATYFLGFEGVKAYENMPILSLTVSPEDLFDSDKGIYVRGGLYDNALEEGLILADFSWTELMDYMNYYLRGSDSERTAHMKYFDSEHMLVLEQECGIRIRGNESRSFPQKNITLFSRKRYEDTVFEPVFFDSGISYPNLILNNSHQLKKVFFFSLVEDRAAATQKYSPCQVFLNGEYWGMYYLMEKYSAEYLESYYGIPRENTLLIKNSWEFQDGNPENISHFKELQEYLEQDMSDPELYEELLTLMDMQSFIDWMCTNIYIVNTDTKPLGGNVFTWQATVPGEAEYQDGKWRWMLYDLDDSLGVGIDIGVPSYAIDSFVEHAGYAPCGFLDDDPMPSLMGNEDFRRQFVLTFMDMANENFRFSRVSALLDDLETQYTDAASKSYERWNTNPIDVPFEQQIEELRTFFANRYDAIVPCLAEHFSLDGDLVSLTLSAENPEGGIVTLNSLTPNLSNGNWEGCYYTDYPITLTAAPMEGYIFTGWEIEDCEPLTDCSNSELQVKLTGNTQPAIRAVFQKNN